MTTLQAETLASDGIYVGGNHAQLAPEEGEILEMIKQNTKGMKT